MPLGGAISPSTNRAQRCLTSQIGRGAVLSTWYRPLAKLARNSPCRSNWIKLSYDKDFSRSFSARGSRNSSPIKFRIDRMKI